DLLLWKVFRRGLKETGVSLTCSQATIHRPRTIHGGALQPPSCSPCSPATQTQRGHRNTPSASTLTYARRNHPPSRTMGSIFIPHRGPPLPWQLLGERVLEETARRIA